MKTAAVLLSRQPLHPCKKTLWVRHAVNAVKWVKHNADALYTSVGMQTWELLVTLAHRYNLKQAIVIPAENETGFNQQCRYITVQFNLNPKISEFIPLYPDTSGNILQQQRDTFIVSHADMLLPVSIRKNGGMQRLLAGHCEKGKEIVTSFQCEYDKKPSPVSYTVRKESLNPALSTVSKQYLIHWTRTSNRAWPDETLYDYYTAILSSDTYPRNARETLAHILFSRRILASSRHIPENIPTVSFSGTAPEEFLPLMRYRARYRQMSFEPYGIGIAKEYAHAAGITKVHYYEKSGDNPIYPSDAWLTQSTGVKSDWQQEDEYRHLGDINLSQIPKNKLCCLCYRPSEAKILSKAYNLNTISFTQ